MGLGSPVTSMKMPMIKLSAAESSAARSRPRSNPDPPASAQPRSALSGAGLRQTGRRMRLLAKAAEALLHALAQPLERHVEHRYHEYPDRACGKHAAEHSGTHRPAADLCSAGRDHQRQQAENEGDGSHHHGAEPHLRTKYRGVRNRDAALALLLGELDNQDAVLGGQCDQHHEADLAVEIEVQAGNLDAE